MRLSNHFHHFAPRYQLITRIGRLDGRCHTNYVQSHAQALAPSKNKPCLVMFQPATSFFTEGSNPFSYQRTNDDIGVSPLSILHSLIVILSCLDLMQINVPHPLLTFQVPRPIGEPLDLGNEWGDKLTSSDALDLKSVSSESKPRVMVSNVQGGRSGARLHCLSLKSAVMTMYDVLSGGTHTIRSTYTIMINHISLVSG